MRFSRCILLLCYILQLYGATESQEIDSMVAETAEAAGEASSHVNQPVDKADIETDERQDAFDAEYFDRRKPEEGTEDATVGESPQSPPETDDSSPSEERHTRMWGTTAKQNGNDKEKPHLEAHVDRSNHTRTNHTGGHHHHLPFIKKKGPPEGFKITARVYIDRSDRLSHIDTESPLIPYFDCGATGLSTTHMDLSKAQIRFSLTQTSYKSNNPVLLVALHDLLLETTSGDEVHIQSGQLILLEDMINPGHTLRALPDQDYLLVMSLSLPHSHPHVGKEHISLPTSRMVSAAAKGEPCPAYIDEDGSSSPSLWTDSPNTLRKVLFGAMGLSLSTLAADFAAKTAPLWLAVGVGGTCFVVGTTTLFVMTMSRLADWAEVALERRQLFHSK